MACARRNGVVAYAGDLFAPLPRELVGAVDVVIGAVPFVPTDELWLLQRDTFTFESPLAYDGGPDGCDILRRVVAESPPVLRAGGALLLALGGRQDELLRPDLERAGFTGVRVFTDEEGDVRGIEATLGSGHDGSRPRTDRRARPRRADAAARARHVAAGRRGRRGGRRQRDRARLPADRHRARLRQRDRRRPWRCAASDVPREELFITSKLNAEWHGFQEAQDAFAMSAEKLGVDYLDLFLIHWPNPRQDRYVDALRGLVELLRTGRVRAIGLSNFKPEHVAARDRRDRRRAGRQPDRARSRRSPARSRAPTTGAHDIVTESWSPLGNGGELLRLPAIAEIAERHGRTTAQIVLRWHVQIGAVPIPKSANPERQAENLAVFDFELDQAEMDAIAELDRGESAATDSDSFGH